MRRVIMWNMVTLDGCFEGSRSWDIDWHEYVWGSELQQFSLEQAKSIATLLFGRAPVHRQASVTSPARPSSGRPSGTTLDWCRGARKTKSSD